MVPAFTSRYPIRSRVLINEVRACKPNDAKNSKKTKAIWDTGATGSVITKKFASELGLIPVGLTIVKGVHEAKKVPWYLIDVILPNNVGIGDVRATECEVLSGDDTGMLIGMDIISLGDFAVSNFNNKTSFSFRIPSQEETDYTQKPVTEKTKSKAEQRKVLGLTSSRSKRKR